MGRSNRNFGGYRGRRTLTDILTIIAIVLGVAVVLVLGALFFAQDYLVDTDGGIRLQLPGNFQNREDPAQSLPDPGSITVIEQEKEEESQTTSHSGAVIRGVQLPVSSLLDQTAKTQMEAAGADALILEMKPQSGLLAWSSQQTLASQSWANGDPAVNQALELLEQEKIYTVARVCCFRDDTVPYYNSDMSLRSGGGNWRDELGLRWLSPGSQQAQRYVASLCGELAAMGVDEIVLEQFHFPVEGNLDGIDWKNGYDPGNFTPQVQNFLQLVEQALAPYGTTLSLWVEGEILSGQGSSCGLSAEMIYEYADRLWAVEDQRSGAEELLSQAGLEQSHLVQIVDALAEDQQLSQAVLSLENQG